MTVIACKDGIMAADTSSWHGDISRGSAIKIHRLEDGLFGTAGWKPIIEQALEWARLGWSADKRPPKTDDDTHLDALFLRTDGSIWCLNNNFVLYQSDSAIDVAGSHSEFLLGAMLAGASAEEAVRLAVRHGKYARGDVQVEHL